VRPPSPRRYHLSSSRSIPDEHRPERPILLTVDQQLAEGAGRGVPQYEPIAANPLEVGEHDEFSDAGSG
jgi:hypothetical protein